MASYIWIDGLRDGLTVAAFAVTIWQVRKTKKAAVAAREAVENTQGALARNHLLVLIPQLQRVEQELDLAVERNDHKLALYHLASWRWQAGQLRGLLVADIGPSADMLRLLQESVTLASEAKNGC